MSISRIIQGLKLARKATKADPANRYQSAMMKRADEIIARANDCDDPDEALPATAQELARAIRQRKAQGISTTNLVEHVRAKLAISNPGFAESHANQKHNSS